MKYSELCEVYEQLEQSPSRLKKTEILSEFLKNIKPEENLEIIYLIQGMVWPDYIEKEFGISGQLTIKALAKTSGLQTSEVIKKYKKIGDLGKVAEDICRDKKQSTLFSSKLTTQKVIENLKKLPELQGKGTVDRKISLIAELLSSASSIEAKYIVRTLLNDLRIGIGSSTLRDSIVWACFPEEEHKEATVCVQSAYDKETDFALVFKRARKGKKELEKTELHPGKPIKVMLAIKAESIKDGFERAGKPCAFEYKYDGFRMLINKDEKGNIKIFTRRLDEVTKQFPEIKEYIQKYVKAKTFIIDSEAVGYDPKTKHYQPFQHISQRIRRKYDIEKTAITLPVEINAFDLLYLNGKSLIDEPFSNRTKLLRKIVSPHKYQFVTSKQLITSNEKEVETFYKAALKEGEEGVMIKNLSSPYKPGARVGDMLKFKPSLKELDLVITGAEYGKGKRAGWLSSFDLACRGKKPGEFLNIGKVGTGIKEKEEQGVSFIQLTKLLKPLITKEHSKHVEVKPKIVITVIYQEIQRSPTYDSKFALRFPRLIALRPDRSPNSIATQEEVENDFDKLNKWRF